jgi:hypothetical protein
MFPNLLFSYEFYLLHEKYTIKQEFVKLVGYAERGYMYKGEQGLIILVSEITEFSLGIFIRFKI